MRRNILTLLLLGAALAGAQEGFQCPHDFGFYPHEIACDKYWACDGGFASTKTCGNGLAFDDTDAEFLRENCDYYHNVDCSTRPERQPAISTTNCPYQYGIFPDTDDCSVFWSCWSGESSRYQCGPGLAYDQGSRICTWIDEVPNCAKQRAEQIDNFVCPAAGELSPIGSFTRHAHPDDCRQFFVCLDSIPREYGCPIGTVFQIGKQDGMGECSDPEVVPGCEQYYGDLDLDAFKKSQLILGNIGAAQNRLPADRGLSPKPSQAASPQSSRPQRLGRPQSQLPEQEVPLDDPSLN